MLGRVFENLLEENYRKGKGAFYTPREIVGYMCKSSIKEYLKDKNDKLQAIKKIKVLDPAIGSGAFPMGMLQTIVQTRVHLGDKTPYAKLKREIIENSIYGVDIDGDAVEIAKLRFWLSLTVDETLPSPLPNLDFKIMQGNSLLETINGFDIIPTDIYEKIVRKQTDLFGGFEEQTLFARTLYEELSEKIHKFYNDTSGVDKKSHKEEIKSLVRQIIEEYLMREEQQYKHHEKNIVSFNSKKKKLADDMSKTLDNILIAQRVLDEILSNNFQSKELFLYKLWFGEVMQDGGFDVVIGNPPYIRQEKIKDLKPKLQIEGYKSYNGTADIYIYFFEQGHRLLKEGGNLSYITSNKYTRAKYGKELRDFVLKNTDILEYIDFNGVKVFESATVDTSILSFRKFASTSSMTTTSSATFLYCDVKSDYKGEDLSDYCQKNGFLYAQNDLTLDSFSFANPAELKIKKKIEAIGTPLKEWDIKINYGIKTGFNEAFIISQEKRDELIAKDAKSAEIIKPILRGRDIKRYGYEWANLWIIVVKYGFNVELDKYPAILEHLMQYEEQLKNRGQCRYSRGGVGQGQHHWLELDNNPKDSYLQQFKEEKIVYPVIANNESIFTYDGNGFYHNDKIFHISANKETKYLTALLNSKVAFWMIKRMCASLGAGFEQRKIFIELLPIPKIPQEAQKPFEIVVDKIMELKAKSEETKELENQIDRKVYELYGLSEDEIGVVTSTGSVTCFGG